MRPPSKCAPSLDPRITMLLLTMLLCANSGTGPRSAECVTRTSGYLRNASGPLTRPSPCAPSTSMPYEKEESHDHNCNA
jgi:hypothetical protein